MRALRAVAASNADAQLAITMFCYSIRKQVAAMAAALGGVDMLVFTGGIGENDAASRASICEGLDWLGIRSESVSTVLNDDSPIDASFRAADRGRPRCVARVMLSQEDEQIARLTWQLTT